MTPDTLLALVNLTVPRKPDRGLTVHPDPLASAPTAMKALSLPRLRRSELGELRELHATVAELVHGMLSRRSVARPAARLTGLARPSTAKLRLDVGEDRTLHAQLEWSDASPAATLARRVIEELGEMDVTRLKSCDRLPCDLIFYDTTRSGTQRWHAESPCGNRERQRRHRTAMRAGPGPNET